MKKVYVLKEYCMGCGLCEVYCATVHSSFPHDVLKAYTLSCEKPVSRAILERSDTQSLSISCRHCKEAPCLEACISGAIYRDPFQKMVLINEEKCIGCSTCVAACPFGVIMYSNSGVFKCDLCYQSGNPPACVINCPNRALVYEEEGNLCT